MYNKNPNVMMVNSGYSGCSYVRMYLPCVYNGFTSDMPNLREARLTPRETRLLMDHADVVVFHRPEEQEFHKLARMLKKDGKRVVMDNDDTYHLEDGHPLAQFNPDGTMYDSLQRRLENLNEFMRLSDLVTTTTQTLAGEYSKQNPNTLILPNYIDPDDWDEPLRNEGDKVRIGLVGSTALEYDYIHLKGLIKELSERDDVEFVMFGLGDAKHRINNPMVTKVFHEEYDFWDSIKKEHFPWCPIWQYREKLNEMKLDIMLIPRRDNYFNRCKSNLKFLEAAMCEVPVIAQSFDNGPYEEITPDMGVLIKDNTKWKEEIERLMKDKELRRSMGKKAKEYVLKNYDIKDHYEKWNNAYSSLLI